MNENKQLKFVTHNGKFHTDEVFATAILSLALKDNNVNLNHMPDDFFFCSGLFLSRTRDQQTIENADIVYDVGLKYEPDKNKFDHHMKERALRSDNITPYSAAGLVFKKYGYQAIVNYLSNDQLKSKILIDDDHEVIKQIYQTLDSNLIFNIDANDNGIFKSDDLSVINVVNDFNRPWNFKYTDSAHRVWDENNQFSSAVEFATGYLCRHIEHAWASKITNQLVLKAYKNSSDQRILELDQGMPWKSVVEKYDLPVLYCIFQVGDGSWRIDTMPVEPESFSQRLPLPAEWAGLEGKDLVKVSGIKDATFIHPSRFIGGSYTREGVMQLAAKALEIGLENNTTLKYK